MEINSSKTNSNSYSTNKLEDKSPAKVIKINQFKNSVIYPNKNRVTKKFHNIKENNDSDDNLDHPQPLKSDFEGNEDVRQTLLLNELRERKNKKNENKEKEKKTENNFNNNLHDKYFNLIKNTQIDYKDKINSTNNNRANNKIVRVNLNEINKNKFKKIVKESNNNQEPNVKASFSYRQNPLQTNENFNSLNITNMRQTTKKNTYTNINRKNIKQINKKFIKKPEVNKNSYNNINNQTTNNKKSIKNNGLNIKEKNNITLNKKQNLNINTREYLNNNTLDNIKKNPTRCTSSNVISLKNESMNNSLNITKLKNSGPQRPKESRYINHIYISQNNKNYRIHQKTNISNVSTKMSSNNIINTYDNNEEIKKETFTRGGKFNNIQTTFVVCSRKSESNNILKENINPNLSDNNNNSNYKIRTLTLNQINSFSSFSNINNSNITDTPLKICNSFSSTRGSNNHICEIKQRRDSIETYQSNNTINFKKIRKPTIRKKPVNLSHNTIFSNRYYNRDYSHYYFYDNKALNISNMKYNNLGGIIEKKGIIYFNGNTLNYDGNTYINTFENDNWFIPYKNHYNYYIQNY